MYKDWSNLTSKYSVHERQLYFCISTIMISRNVFTIGYQSSIVAIHKWNPYGIYNEKDMYEIDHGNTGWWSG